MAVILGATTQAEATAMLARIGLQPAVSAVRPGLTLAGGPGATLDQEGPITVLFGGLVHNPEEFPRGLAAAIAARGTDSVLRALNADFAIAVHDARDGSLTLARDRFGIRPLYHRGGLPFASRPRCFADLTPRPDYMMTVAAANYRLLDVFPERSPYVGIDRLPAGHLWRGVAKPYASFEAKPLPGGIDAQAEAYRELLRDAVGRRLRHAAAPAFSLSGGLDSSSVTMLAHGLLGRTVNATSSIYGGGAYDEAREINDVVQTGACDWHPVALAEPDLVGEVSRLVRQHDEPIATVTWMAHAALCRSAAARGHDSLFSGLGGDEQHAGEYDYFFYHFADLAAAGESALRDHEIACWVRHHDHPVHRKSAAVATRRAAQLTDPRHPGQCRLDAGLLVAYRHLVPALTDPVALVPTLPRPTKSYLSSHSLNELLLNTMPCCLRASAASADAAGLKTLHPFLDHRLFDAMLAVPGREKITDGITKQFVRRAMRGVLPEATRTRITKTGWNAPADRWFAGPWREPTLDLITSRAFREMGLYDPVAVEALVADHVAIVHDGNKRQNHAMPLWQLVNLTLWMASLRPGA